MRAYVGQIYGSSFTAPVTCMLFINDSRLPRGGFYGRGSDLVIFSCRQFALTGLHSVFFDPGFHRSLFSNRLVHAMDPRFWIHLSAKLGGINYLGAWATEVCLTYLILSRLRNLRRGCLGFEIVVPAAAFFCFSCPYLNLSSP